MVSLKPDTHHSASYNEANHYSQQINWDLHKHIRADVIVINLSQKSTFRALMAAKSAISCE